MLLPLLNTAYSIGFKTYSKNPTPPYPPPPYRTMVPIASMALLLVAIVYGESSPNATSTIQQLLVDQIIANTEENGLRPFANVGGQSFRGLDSELLRAAFHGKRTVFVGDSTL